jgi:hypothetical protein
MAMPLMLFDVVPHHYNSFSCFLKLPVLLLLFFLSFFLSLGQNYLHNHPAGHSEVKSVHNELLVL